MEISPSESVGRIAARLPATTRVFERFAIDYCCRGKQSLEAACTAQGLAVGPVLTALEAAGEPRASTEASWNDASMEALVEHLLGTHHVFTRSELDRIEVLGRKVLNAHGAAHPALRDLVGLAQALRDELLPHMMKEENVLFPYIRALGRGSRIRAPFTSVRVPVAMMEHEHEVAGDLLEKLRAATAGYVAPPDACPTWRALYESLQSLEADLHRHIHLESSVLFPRAADAEAALAADR